MVNSSHKINHSQSFSQKFQQVNFSQTKLTEMFKKGGIVILLILFSPIILWILMMLIIPILWDYQMQKEVMMKTPHVCKKGTVEKIEGYGKTGYSRFCLKNGVKNGHWEVWEKQYKCIEGNYSNWKEEWEWIIWNKDGSISKKMYYKNGIILSVK